MATYTETRTTPTDVLNRLQEVEVVLQAVIDKIANLEPGEGGDVSASQASLDRLYKLTLRTAQPDASPTPGDFDETTIFDDGSGNGSLYATIHEMVPLAQKRLAQSRQARQNKMPPELRERIIASAKAKRGDGDDNVVELSSRRDKSPGYRPRGM